MILKHPGTLLSLLIAVAVAVGGLIYGVSALRQTAGLREQRDFLEQRVRLLEDENVMLEGLVDRLERAGAVDDPEAVIRRDIELVVAELRGLEWRERIPYKIVTRDGVADLAREKLRGPQIEAESARRRMQAWAVLGLIDRTGEGEPPAWERIVGELYDGGASAFYDESRPAMHVARGTPLEEAAERAQLVHELTLALLDQYHDLEAFLEPETDRLWRNSDAALARRAVVAGDATILALRYNRDYGSAMVEADGEPAECGALASMAGAIGSDGTKGNVPPGAALSAIFPHTEGRSFSSALAAAGGAAALDEAYRRPPGSTSEIMHPDIYRAGSLEARRYDWKEKAMRLPEREIIWSDVAGEWGVCLLLRRHLDEGAARAAAAGWRGDRFIVYAGAAAGTQDGDLLWVSSWKDAAAAAVFRDALSGSLQRRYGLKEPVSGTYDGARFLSLELVDGDVEVILADAGTANRRAQILDRAK